MLFSLIVYSIKSVHESYCCCSSIACQEKITDWIVRIFTFNDKNPLYLPIILVGRVFLGSMGSGSNPNWHIPKIKNSGFKLKKVPGFSNLLFVIHLFFEKIPLINSKTKPPYPMINVVCKYMRQFLGTRFGITTLLMSWNIE